MDQKDLLIEQLRFGNKMLRDMLAVFDRWTGSPRPPAMQRELDKLLHEAAANRPAHWPKLEPEAQKAMVNRWLKGDLPPHE